MNHRSSSDLPTQLHHEWRRMRRRPDHLLRAAGWDIVEGPLNDLDQVLTAIGYGVEATPTSDERLHRLVALAHGDELAARIVVQRLLPGSLSVLRKWHRPGRIDDPVVNVIGALWIAIRTYNLDRRPACLAAALIGDAEHLAFRKPSRRKSADESPTDFAHDLVQPDAVPHPYDELAALVDEAEAAAAADPDDISLLRRYVDMPNVAELARAMNVSVRTVNNRRRRATDRLREFAA